MGRVCGRCEFRKLGISFARLAGHSLYRSPEDWIFACPALKVENPLWLDNFPNRYLRRAFQAAGVTERRSDGILSGEV